jgi:Fe-S cluster assembly protein SufD
MTALPAMPTNRDDNWRYANLRPLAKASPRRAPAGAASAIARPACLPGHEHWVFVDGHFNVGLSSVSRNDIAWLSRFEPGNGAQTLLDVELASAGVDFALARANAEHGEQVLMIYPGGAPRDGAPANVTPQGPPARVELTFITTQPANAGTSYPRIQVHAARGSRLDLVERHVSIGEAPSAVNAAVDIGIATDAHVEHTRLQNCANTVTSFDTLVVNVGERACYKLRTVTVGGLSSRSTSFIKLAGRGSRCELIAAAIANGIQTHDMFAEIEHVGPGSATRELFRGIASERGKLAFNGKMIVREGAHDADSDQSLKTLLTGSGAEAAARPQLEIYTDKVRAKHGATTGKLDEQMLFYLLSRGIDRPRAQALLQWAFIEDAVSQVQLAPLRQEIEQIVAAQLDEVSNLGLVDRP